MSSEEETNIPYLNKNNEKNSDYSETDKVSLLFVDTLFKNIPTESKVIQDPLNTKQNLINIGSTDIKNQNSDLKTPQKNTKNTDISSKISNTKSSQKSNHKYNSIEKTDETTNKKEKNFHTVSSAKNIKNPNLYTNKEKNQKINKFIKNKNKNNPISEKYIAKQESEKEKKYYQQKVKLLENRILALKKQEEDMNKKKHCNEIRQNYLNKMKKEKYDFKQKLLSYDIDKRNALEEKRMAIKEQKLKLNNELKESMEKTKFTKIKNYKKLMKEKKTGINIINENNKNFEKYGKNNVYKIKKEREDFKMKEIKKQKNHGKTMDNYYLESCEDNKQETDKLKDKIERLEKLETEYLNTINETRRGIIRNNSTGIYFIKRDMSPIQKLDLDEQMDGKYIASKYRNRKNKKNSVNKNLLHQSYNGDIENNWSEKGNENENKKKIIKVEKKIGLNYKK